MSIFNENPTIFGASREITDEMRKVTSEPIIMGYFSGGDIPITTEYIRSLLDYIIVLTKNDTGNDFFNSDRTLKEYSDIYSLFNSGSYNLLSGYFLIKMKDIVEKFTTLKTKYKVGEKTKYINCPFNEEGSEITITNVNSDNTYDIEYLNTPVEDFEAFKLTLNPGAFYAPSCRL